jgi:predicted DNA-binding protein YlxM (UPF0122 family)
MEDVRTKIKGLLLQNFSNDEVATILKINQEEILVVANELAAMPIQDNSTEYYKELQKELSKLVLTEINKPGRDSGVVLNAIKLQAEIQEKKLALNKTIKSGAKISKDYIYERDEKMYELSSQSNMSTLEIAKKFGVSNLTVENAIDRCSLQLPDELKTLSPSIIAETFITGIDKESRMKILWNAYQNNLTRAQIRAQINELKNEIRKR